MPDLLVRPPVSPWPLMFIDVQHGLCNRLRALVSGLAIAERTGHLPVVVWCPDHHCEAGIADLLDYSGTVIGDRDLAEEIRAQTGQQYNYMEIEPGARFGAPILPGPQDVYIRSAYTLAGPHGSFEREQRILRRLQPAAPVRDLVRTLPGPHALAVHVRAEGLEEAAAASYDNAANWPEQRHREITGWRARSQAGRFIARVDDLVAAGAAETIFLAADREQTYAIFADRYGDRLRWLRRDLFDRSARQLQYALADLMHLSAGRRFLASTWSSFSDLAQRLARPGRRVEQSGKDF